MPVLVLSVTGGNCTLYLIINNNQLLLHLSILACNHLLPTALNLANYESGGTLNINCL